MKTENQTRVKDERNKEHVVSEVEDKGNQNYDVAGLEFNSQIQVCENM